MPAPTNSRDLIIFDVDGTLVDAIALDNDCFDRAFSETAGRALTEEMWSQFKEVTAPAIIQQALGNAWPDMLATKMRIKNSFLDKLQQGYEQDRASIQAFPGAVALLSGLQKNPDVGVAIATGCWRETAQFKLTSAGFDLSNIPFACASDCNKRAEIILLAAERTGQSIERAVYVGDGVWDLRAARQLGVPFIGVGRRIETLRKAGAEYILDAFEEDALVSVLASIRR